MDLVQGGSSVHRPGPRPWSVVHPDMHRGQRDQSNAWSSAPVRSGLADHDLDQVQPGRSQWPALLVDQPAGHASVRDRACAQQPRPLSRVGAWPRPRRTAAGPTEVATWATADGRMPPGAAAWGGTARSVAADALTFAPPSAPPPLGARRRARPTATVEAHLDLQCFARRLFLPIRGAVIMRAREPRTAVPIHATTTGNARMRSEDLSSWYRHGTTTGADHG